MLELARYQAGPRCGMILSDLGADVIKIEPPGGEVTRGTPPAVNGQSLYFAVYNRGKRSVCLDLHTESGKAVLRDLVATADLVLENFRPGTMASMGFGYEALREIKRDIILLSISAFGQYGPHRDRGGFDAMGQALSGLMSLTGRQEGKPIGTASSIVDRYTALHATIGALAALRHRDETGQGQVVDVCLMDAALTMVEIPTSYYLSTGLEGGESGRAPYRARDGWVVITATTTAMMRRLSEIMGIQVESTQAIGFPGNRNPAEKGVVDWCAERGVDEICAALSAAGIPVAPVLATPQVVSDPHMWEREMLVRTPDPIAGELFLPGLTIKFSAAPGRLGPVPMAGEHTRAVLESLLEYTADRIDHLRSDGAFGPLGGPSQ